MLSTHEAHETPVLAVKVEPSYSAAKIDCMLNSGVEAQRHTIGTSSLLQSTIGIEDWSSCDLKLVMSMSIIASIDDQEAAG